jgi:hypothetical protein
MTPLETRQTGRLAELPFEDFGRYFKALRQLHVDSAGGREGAAAIDDRWSCERPTDATG